MLKSVRGILNHTPMKLLSKSTLRAVSTVAIFAILWTTTFALSITETTLTDFGTGSHNNTRAVSWDDGEVILDYDASTKESALSTLPASANYDIRPRIQADKEGIVYAVWHEDAGNSSLNDIWFAKSGDGGLNWSNPVKIDNGDVNCPSFPANSILPDLIVDDSESPTKVYVTWTDNRTIQVCGPGRFYNIWFSASVDGGQNWSQDVMVNNYPTLSGHGSLLGNPDVISDYERTYPTGGPRLALSPAPRYDILVTWMNDEVWWGDYDVYYSKSLATQPSYVFDADWTTECEPENPFEKGFGEDGCEDAKIDNNLSDEEGVYSGVAAIDSHFDQVVIVYEDDRLKWYPATNIFSVNFTEYGNAVSPFPLVGGELIPTVTAPPYPHPGNTSVQVDDDGDYSSREPDVEISANEEVLVVWDDDAPSGNNVVYFDKATLSYTDYGSDIRVSDKQDAYFPNIESNPDNGNQIFLTYDDENDSTTGINFDKSEDGGLNWGTDVSIVGADGNIEAVHSDLTFSPKTKSLISIWGDMDLSDSRGDGSTDYDIYSSRSLDFGDNWGHYYIASDANTGYTSQAIDLGSPQIMSEQTLSWTEDLTQGGDIRIQIRTAQTQSGLAEASFVGPGGDDSTFYVTPEGTTMHAIHDGDQWVQYLAFFTSDSDRTATPVLKDLTFGIAESEMDEEEEGEDTVDTGDGTCETNAECGYGETCKDGMCLDLSLDNDLCSDNEDCDEGQICTSAGYCGEKDSCAGFPDVSSEDPQCEAIKYVKDEGIFEGYPDGTFGPEKVINRAETGKVILETFNYETGEDDGTNLGYSDVETGAWYMPYLAAAQSNEIITGYPDGTVKPGQTVNKVELLKIFFKAAPVTVEACEPQPYPDTPIDEGTEWYIPFVCYAKENKLMDAELTGNFYPSDGMLRGDVAELFYRYDNRVGEY
jgi:hypothetical protein